MAGMTATGRPSPTGKSRGGPYLSSNRDCFSLNGKPSMNPTQSPQEAKSKYNVEKAQYDTVEHFHCQLSVMVHSLWPDMWPDQLQDHCVRLVPQIKYVCRKT